MGLGQITSAEDRVSSHAKSRHGNVQRSITAVKVSSTEDSFNGCCLGLYPGYVIYHSGVLAGMVDTLTEIILMENIYQIVVAEYLR